MTTDERLDEVRRATGEIRELVHAIDKRLVVVETKAVLYGTIAATAVAGAITIGARFIR